MLQITNIYYSVKKLSSIAVLLILLSSSLVSATNKHVIGCWKSGFFSTFLGVLNHLHWCNQNNKIPVVYWDNSCFYSQQNAGGNINAWENYFEPVSSLRYSNGDEVHHHYSVTYNIGDSTFMMGTNDSNSRNLAHGLITKYIKLKPALLTKIDEFYNAKMRGKKTIGIHLRGTDKVMETPPVPLSQIIQVALENADADTQFFIATEDVKMFQEAKNLLKGRVVLYRDCIRVATQTWAWFQYQPNKVLLGQEVLIDMILLSRCDKLIHTPSNVSTAALFFNPALEHIMLINGAVSY